MTKDLSPKKSSRTPPRKKQAPREQCHHKIREAAYYRAEKDGFRKNPVEYWLAAEAETGE